MPRRTTSFRCMEAGAAGYLVKSAADRELVDAVRAVAHGDVYVRPARRAGAREEPHEEGSGRRRSVNGSRSSRNASEMSCATSLRATRRRRSARSCSSAPRRWTRTSSGFRKSSAWRTDPTTFSSRSSWGFFRRAEHLLIPWLVAGLAAALLVAQQVIRQIAARERSERVEDELRASEAKFSGHPGHRRRRNHHGRSQPADRSLQPRRRRDLRVQGERRDRTAPVNPASAAISGGARRAHRALRAIAGDGAAHGRAPRDLRAPRRRHRVSRRSVDLEARRLRTDSCSPSCCATSPYSSAPKRTSGFSRRVGRARAYARRRRDDCVRSSICRFRGLPTRACSTSLTRRALAAERSRASRARDSGPSSPRRSTRSAAHRLDADSPSPIVDVDSARPAGARRRDRRRLAREQRRSRGGRRIGARSARTRSSCCRSSPVRRAGRSRSFAPGPRVLRPAAARARREVRRTCGDRAGERAALRRGAACEPRARRGAGRRVARSAQSDQRHRDVRACARGESAGERRGAARAARDDSGIDRVGESPDRRSARRREHRAGAIVARDAARRSRRRSRCRRCTCSRSRPKQHGIALEARLPTNHAARRRRSDARRAGAWQPAAQRDQVHAARWANR